MSDVPVEPDEEDFEDDEESEDEDSAEAPKPATSSRNFIDLPDGYLTLVGFAKRLAQKPPAGRFVAVKPQVLYSTAKNTKNFPAEQHTDGRWIINIEKGLEWWDGKEARKAEKAAAAVPTPEDSDESVDA
jgi:hypothetical protein